MKNKLTQYRGPLSPSQAAKGIAMARANAARLIEDAELLHREGRHPSAIALAILAIEELGKVQAIKIIVLQNDASELKRAWADYRSHRAKNVMWILPKLAAEGARTLMQLRPAADPDGEHTAMLDAIKQLAFYTDCYGEKGRWSEPLDAVEPEFAPAIIATARMLNRDAETTERELDLWVELVGPHYNKPTMPAALVNFQQQIFEEGLSDVHPAKMAAFVSGRPIEVPS